MIWEGTHIRINTPLYRQWKVQQNKKNLIRRTEKKRAEKIERAALTRPRSNINNNNKSNTNNYNNRKSFIAPPIFSFIADPNGTTAFFEEIIAFITTNTNQRQELFIDISQIKELTIDALMYLLAIVNNLNGNFKENHTFIGNYPQDFQVRKLMHNSGFEKFVQYYGDEPITRDADNIQIVSGNNVNTVLAKRICDFVIGKGNMTKVECQFLYNMIIELMANVYNHAYNDIDGILYSRWYCFVEFNSESDTVYFTFMDTGDGIPSTVRKYFFEHLDVFNIKGDDAYVLSALRGQLRSETKKKYRGKGLPKIFDTCQSEQIQNMRIITNKADVTVRGKKLTSKELSVSLRGTLFYWQINLSKFIKGGI